MAREKTTEEDAFQPTQTGSLPPEAYQTQQDKVTLAGTPAYPLDETPPETEAARRKKADEDAKAKKAKDDEDEAKEKAAKKGR